MTKKLTSIKFSPQMTEEVAGYFKMLSEPVRLHMLGSICSEGAATIGELTERLGLCQSVVSRHMKLMTEHGVVCKKIENGRTLYYFADDCLCSICAPVVEKIRARAAEQSRLL
ncbi:MAG: helix-turn-helix transcriptional regulator [Akkermansia sp.]|nr:helix-turn-helix transcriptional regulator [Akkermansia sp.]MBQ7023745.1 helix-turn-helix transcriptional regulator [Akkermansia sp.]